MSKTFRQKIKEIACSHCNFGDGFHDVDCKYASADKTCPRDRICEAVAGLAEGMPKRYRLDYEKKTVDPAYSHYCDGAKSQYKQCQAFVRKECK